MNTAQEDKTDPGTVYTCSFCGNQETWYGTPHIAHKTMLGCGLCVPKGKPGEKIKYVGHKRRGSQHTERTFRKDVVYTVLKAVQWQHGRDVVLKEFGHHRFDIYCFVPFDFDQTKILI